MGLKTHLIIGNLDLLILDIPVILRKYPLYLQQIQIDRLQCIHLKTLPPTILIHKKINPKDVILLQWHMGAMTILRL